MGNYDDIIHMNRPLDPKHKPMSMNNRAAQFAPFDALTGFGGKISETSRLTDRQIELSDDAKERINEKLNEISFALNSMDIPSPKISVTRFLSDDKKEGGSYETLAGTALKIDLYNKQLLLEDELLDRYYIKFEDITELDIQ